MLKSIFKTMTSNVNCCNLPYYEVSHQYSPFQHLVGGGLHWEDYTWIHQAMCITMSSPNKPKSASADNKIKPWWIFEDDHHQLAETRTLTFSLAEEMCLHLHMSCTINCYTILCCLFPSYNLTSHLSYSCILRSQMSVHITIHLSSMLVFTLP